MCCSSTTTGSGVWPATGQLWKPSWWSVSFTHGRGHPKKTAHRSPPLTGNEWKRQEWIINTKIPKTFVTLNDQLHEYRNWYNRVRDHLILSNIGWGRVSNWLGISPPNFNTCMFTVHCLAPCSLVKFACCSRFFLQCTTNLLKLWIAT